MSKIQFKPGDTLQWAGSLSLFGVPNFTGYTLQCQIRQRSESASPGVPQDTVLAQVDAEWVDATTGTFLLTVEEDITALWPVNTVLYIDVALIDPGGNIATTETAEFQTVPRITVVT